jgi:hypothetical protein
MANTVTFKVKIDDAGTFKKVEVDADELGNAINSVKDSASKLKAEFVNLASVSQIIEGVSSAVQQLNGIFSELTGAYALQSQAETRLAQAMRNTMDASDEEIQSIKDLCAEQQKLGIIGDEVQLAAAQELATYLEFSDSLKTIIPVLNNMVAQQLGLGASAESATQIATMLGKVMNGQTEALSRYGYKFDEAQKYILQFGEEAERAAVLAAVVNESVGGMNEAMAATKPGQMQQVANSIGDIKEQMGAVLSSAMPVVSIFSELTMAASGILRLVQAFKALNVQNLATKVSAMGAAAAQTLQATAAKILGVSNFTAANATRALKVQVMALEAALTLGLSVAITAVVSLLGSLIGRSKQAADNIEEVDDAQQAYNDTTYQSRLEIAGEIVALENLIKKKKSEGEKVTELNSKYGEAFGYYSTASEWYDVLKAKSADYCKQLGYEAKAKVLAAKSGEAQVQLDEINKQIEGFQGKKTRRNGKNTKEYQTLLDQRDALSATVVDLDSQYRDCLTSAQQLAESMTSGAAKTSEAISWQEMSLADLTKAIQLQKEKVESLAGTNEKAAAKAEAAILRQMQARQKALQKSYGLDTNKKSEYDGSSFISGASSYKELGNNIKYYQEQLEKTSPAEKEEIKRLSQEIAVLKKAQKEIKDMQEAASRPAELNSLEEIDEEIAYQQSLRKSASADMIAGIDAEIKRLKNLKTAFEDSSHVSLSIDQIKTYEQLDAEIDFYSRKLKTASETERVEIQKQINSLNELKTKWDDVLNELKRPGDISTLNTIEELDEAVAYYQAIQKKQSGEEIQQTQAVIDALNKKKDAMMSFTSIGAMQKEVARIDGMSGKQLKMELELLGLDGVKNKIRELQKMLDNTENPLDDSQRASVEKLIESYSSYQKVLQRSNVTVSQGWSAIKGIGDSVSTLTSTLEGDGNAWEKLSSVIDTVLSLYDNFSGIIEIIQLLTTVTNAHTIAKQAEGVAEAETASLAVAGAAQTVAASSAVTTAKEAETTTNVAAGASGAIAAHSGIPFVGIALGLAAVGAIIAMMASLPKFAKGGIAYGPTLGLFGEYSGAANNPEVVAPLDRLKTLIGGNNGVLENVQFKIRGRDLVGIIVKEQQIASRVG